MDANSSKEIDPLEITAAEYLKATGEGTLQAELLDVRETWELQRGILPGAQHFPLSTFTQTMHKLNPEKQYVIYCEHGIRSYDAAAWLSLRGFRAVSLQGGFAVWNGPIEPPGKPD